MTSRVHLTQRQGALGQLTRDTTASEWQSNKEAIGTIGVVILEEKAVAPNSSLRTGTTKTKATNIITKQENVIINIAAQEDDSYILLGKIPTGGVLFQVPLRIASGEASSEIPEERSLPTRTEVLLRIVHWQSWPRE